MLLVPFLAGTTLATWSWWSVLLLVAWLMAYLVFYFAAQWLRAARRQQFVAPLRLYASLLAGAGVPLVVFNPRLLLSVPVFAPFVAINLYYARRKRPRAWQNGIASATAACLMAPVSYWFAGGGEESIAAWLFVVTWLYFAGTVLYVKTTIRERGNKHYLVTSIAFHTIAMVAAAAIDLWLGPLFALYLVRATVMPRHQTSPAQIGALEIVNSAVLFAAIVLLL